VNHVATNGGFYHQSLGFLDDQWIGARENVRETMVKTPIQFLGVSYGFPAIFP